MALGCTKKVKLYKSVEFWILILFVVRLIGITNPPLEMNHHWRQITGLMVSRNFCEMECNPFYPRVDDTNGGEGIIGMEFPAMNLIYYGMAKLFGYTHWYGRLINLIISSLGLLFFVKTLRLLRFPEKTILASTLFLGVSIWFSFSRKMMPDTFCVSIMVAALYFGLRHLQGGKLWNLILYMILCAIAVLSKIPAAIYLVFLAPFFFDSSYGMSRRISLVAISIIPVALMVWWYFVWNSYLSQEYGYWYNVGLPFKEGFMETISNWDLTLKRFYFDAFVGFSIFVLFVIGLFLIFIRRERKLIVIFSLPFALFIVYVFKSGHNFYDQNYYIIPIVPVMALVAGNAAATLSTKKWLFILLLVAGSAESIANQQHDFFTPVSQQYKMELENIVNQVVGKNDLIMVNGSNDPQMIYLSHRKGWSCDNEKLLDQNYVDQAVNKNCKFMVIDKHLDPVIPQDKAVIFENDDYIILSLQKVAPQF